MQDPGRDLGGESAVRKFDGLLHNGVRAGIHHRAGPRLFGRLERRAVDVQDEVLADAGTGAGARLEEWLH